MTPRRSESFARRPELLQKRYQNCNDIRGLFHGNKNNVANQTVESVPKK